VCRVHLRPAMAPVRASLKPLPVVHAAVHDLITQGRVCTLGALIVDSGIGRNLEAIVTPSPRLRLPKQFPAHSSLAAMLGNVPPLDVAHRFQGIAPVCVRT